jgi:cobalt-zinc-cadmium efflux system protein
MSHEHQHDIPESNLKLAVGITSLFMLVEIAGGYLSGSLSLLSDAAHMFSHVFSLLLSWYALRLSRKIPTETKTFGFHRTEIFAAFINGSSLVAVAALILYNAYIRISQPVEIESGLMFIIAVMGLIVNLIVMFKLQGHRDLNIRSAYVHVLWDTISSVAVISAAVIIYFTGIYMVDTAISLIIAILILKTSIELVSETLNVLLLGTPKGIDINEVISEMKKVQGVLDVHGVHLWSVCSNINVLDAYIHSCETSLKKTCQIVAKLNGKLEKFSIKHTTFQFECDRCPVEKFKKLKH